MYLISMGGPVKNISDYTFTWPYLLGHEQLLLDFYVEFCRRL